MIATRRDFLRNTAAALSLPIVAPLISYEPVLPKPKPKPITKYGDVYGRDDQLGLHIEGINWIPNFFWTYRRFNGDARGLVGSLRLTFTLKDAKVLSQDLWDWSKPTPFKREGGKLDYVVDSRIVTLWDFANNRQECLADVHPVSIGSQFTKSGWELLTMDLYFGEMIDCFRGFDEAALDEFYAVHVCGFQPLGEPLKLDGELKDALINELC